MTAAAGPRSGKDTALRRQGLLFSQPVRRALIAYVIFLLIWHFGSTSGNWLGYKLPVLGVIPTPLSVAEAGMTLMQDPHYWQSWYKSFSRVLEGFAAAVIIGVPFGIFLAISKTAHGICFPVFELLRPIPPLAWVPAAIVFWPTQELSIASVIFLGAFYTIVINVVGGAQAIDARFLQVARSMGGSHWNIFRRIVLPGILPSIFVGMEVGMGITWEVVVAAEMISGGGSGGADGGLGFFIWNSYVGGSYPQILMGMISIGMAGYLSSSAIRSLEPFATPWLKAR